MATAIQFDYELCPETIEISNIVINTFLPLKANRVIS